MEHTVNEKRQYPFKLNREERGFQRELDGFIGMLDQENRGTFDIPNSYSRVELPNQNYQMMKEQILLTFNCLPITQHGACRATLRFI